MKYFVFTLGFILISSSIFSQASTYPEIDIPSSWYEQHLRFLASDELRGRRTGAPGNQIAARYLAEQFRYHGLDTVQGAQGYFQYMPFARVQSAVGGDLVWGDTLFSYGEELIWLSPKGISGKVQAIWAGNGWVDEKKGVNDYEGKDVKGKVVVIASGFPGAKSPLEVLQSTVQKRKFAADHGAIGVIEVYRERIPWAFISRRYMGERLAPVPDANLPFAPSTMPHAYLQDPGQLVEERLVEAGEYEIEFLGQIREGSEAYVEVPNIIGTIPGSDPSLKDEYLLLTAHFDHVGVGAQGGAYTAEDSIFNGARDNGMGTVALLGAIKALSEKPPKRSVICMALNAEEIGLLGSAYYADHPLIPLKQTVFNLNTDGGGYNDTTAISIMGMDRVGAKEEMAAACEAFGLSYIVDPAPEQNLFDRSDNVSFARKGVPAPTFSPGFGQFDQEIFKYYHQVTDEVGSINWAYLHKYARAFAHAARLIADKAERPQWIEGDKYEPAAKELYGE